MPGLGSAGYAWAAGATWGAGVDEVGVGPLAGPVAACAVLLREDMWFPWYDDVRDSKMLTAPEREELDAVVRASVPFAIGWCSSEEIDRINIYEARRLCVMRALEALPERPDHVISDALKLPLEGVRPIVRADAQCVSVAAASIVAKVARDALMVEMCERYPGYAFCRNKGYATPEHKRLIDRRGPCPIHRHSWKPFAQYAFDW
jgi:ribonuclease HII